MTTTHPSKTVTVYTTGPRCVQCNATKKWLDTHGVPYEAHDVTLDPEAAQQLKALGYTQAPVVLVSGTFDADVHWSGFNPNALGEYTKEVA